MSASPLFSAAQVMLNYLIPLAAKQISLAWGFKDELQRLCDKLELIRALLRDAENRGVIIRLETIQLWLKKLKSVACCADDVLDEFKFETLRRKIEVQNRLKKKVRNFFSLSNPLPFRLKMAHKVKHINLLFDNLCKEANDIGLRPADQILNAASTSVEPRELNFRLTHPFVDDSQVVGRDGDVSTVIDICKMHDLVHDLALDVSEGNCLALTSIASEANYHPEVQHLSFDLKRNISFEIPKENVGKLRTIFLTKNVPKNIAEVKCIRALSSEAIFMIELPYL
ncbi:hypothetical protein TEA_012910 [Camellia sinensis var. sinensis]|uniref:Disease resistance N-terminal domain-containing protein n=1 Tax=Camellia sinensis var. sinensis TaxID=542762 RepID=A0A4S4DQU0_CAMSN|nr:hypothetical protein TEA_012910 [Camellia sinensis var. sinensis]